MIDTVAADHAIKAYLDLLKLDGTLVLVGITEKPLALHAIDLIGQRRSVAGSLIGSIAETQDSIRASRRQRPGYKYSLMVILSCLHGYDDTLSPPPRPFAGNICKAAIAAIIF